MKHQAFKYKNLVYSLLFWIMLSVVITLIALWLQPNSMKAMLSLLVSSPLLAVLNCLPVLLLTLVMGLLWDNLWLGAGVVHLMIQVVALAARFKEILREEVFLPRDFLLLREAGQALADYSIEISMGILGVLILSLFAMISVGIIWRKNWISGLGLRLRLSVAMVGMVAFVVLTMTVYASGDLYDSFSCTNIYNQMTVYNERGVLYSFIHGFTTNTLIVPDGFDRSAAEAWDAAVTVSTQESGVHLILVMNESFTDLTDNEVFTYAEEDDPLSFFHSLQSDAHAISGHTVVTNFGGGTSNTEFDVLTGIQSYTVSSTSAFGLVATNMDSLFRVFNTAGYTTSFIHPGQSWFYNRLNVYQRLGAQSTLFFNDLESPEKKGSWVSDAYTAQLVIDSFEAALEANMLSMSYTTTIQNHMSYTLEKYGADYVFPEVATEVELSDTADALLKVYIEGLRDADSMLETLVEYFSQTEEPVVLAFFGDHFPNLGESGLSYNELGLGATDQIPFKMYATPYVIWANDAAAQALDWDTAVEALELPKNGYLSASFFGAAILELCGYSNTAWNVFLNQLRRELPVVWCDRYYMDGEGTLLTELSDTQQTLIDQWRCWSYYRLKYQTITN